MNRDDVVAFLVACKPLLNRIAIEGENLELTEEDHKTLSDFYQVWLSGWLGESKIYYETELNHKDIRLLFSLYDKTLQGR